MYQILITTRSIITNNSIAIDVRTLSFPNRDAGDLAFKKLQENEECSLHHTSREVIKLY